MKKIQIIFTQEKSFPYKKAPDTVNTILKNYASSKYIDVKKGFIKSVLPAKTLYIVAQIGTKELSNDKLQELGAKAAKQAIATVKKEEKGEIKVIFDASIKKNTQFFLEKGIHLAQSNSARFKSEQEQGTVAFTGLKDERLAAITAAMDVSRDLIAQPSNILTPDAFEDFVKQMVKKDKNLKIKVLKEKDLKKQGMNMHLAVNAGSENEARLICIEYTPKKSKDAPLALVGKGLIYDCGGLYAKPYPHMNDMHGDMGGAATVVAIMSALSTLGIEQKVVGVCGLAENLIDAKSYRNGDILTSRKGLTVYVDHSDAEGRLVLGDALNYTEETYKPEMIFDFATLTGAVVAAVGEMYTGIFTDNKKLIDSFQKIGEEVNDKVWPLPFDDDIKDAVKDKRADLSNTGKLSRILGASTAAAFLSNFVSDTKKWIHFDIAGTAHRDQMRKAYDLKGLMGTGSAVHLILEYLLKKQK